MRHDVLLAAAVLPSTPAVATICSAEVRAHGISSQHGCPGGEADVACRSLSVREESVAAACGLVARHPSHRDEDAFRDIGCKRPGNVSHDALERADAAPIRTIGVKFIRRVDDDRDVDQRDPSTARRRFERACASRR